MRQPEEYYWLWLVGGYKGLTAQINKLFTFGSKPPIDFVNQLKKARDELNETIALCDTALQS